MIVAIDVDGTLIDEDDNWLPGAADALRRIARHNTVIIHSCRANWQAGRAFIDDLLREVRLNRSARVHVHVAPGKPQADVYIDDKALRFTGDWAETLDQLVRL